MWIPALSAIGAGFAIGLAAIGSGVGQGSGTEAASCFSTSSAAAGLLLRVGANSFQGEATRPSKEAAHEWWKGVRVGEASHPGPSASNATRRKRLESAAELGSATTQSSDCNGALGLGLMGGIKPLIEEMVNTIMKPIMQEITKMFACGGLSLPIVPGWRGLPARTRGKARAQTAA